MQRGNGGLSVHKHGIGGGYSPPSAKTKMMRALETNKATEQATAQKTKPRMHQTVAEAMKHESKR